MRTESSVPVEERILYVEGILSDVTFDAVKSGLPCDAKAKECFFSHYAYADIPLPKIFDVIFDVSDTRSHEAIAVRIVAATQQFAIADSQISHGWKMICWLGDSARQSKLLQSLPRVSSWYESNRCVGLCSCETWEKMSPAGC